MGIHRHNQNPIPSNPPSRGIYRGDDEPIGASPAPPPIPTTTLPVNSVAPSISGGATPGIVIIATAGTWSGNPTILRAWLRDGVVIAGQNGISYLPTNADAGKSITHREYASNAAGTVTQDSNAIVVGSVANLPDIVSLPFIQAQSSPITVGTQLIGQAGSYTDVVSVTRKWTRDGQAIAGATAFTYIVANADIGEDIRFVEILANADGTVEAISAAIVPVAPTTNEDGALQIINLEDEPVDVSVVRSSTGATYRRSDGKVVIAAANTPRYHYNSDGSFAGIYVEPARTNYLSHGTRIGDTAGGYNLGSGVTVTLNAAESPDGQTTASRIQINAGTAQRGITKGFSVPAGRLRSSIFLRNRGTGTVSIILRDPVTGYQPVSVPTTWVRFDFEGQNEGGSWFNFTLLSEDGNAKDIEAHFGDVTPGGALSDSLIASGASSQARVAEVLTAATILGGVRDIRVTFNDDSTQNIVNQTLANGVISINASQLNKTLIKTLEVFAVGTIPTAGTPPPPAPPPTSGSVWTSEEVEAGILNASGLNEGLIINVDNTAGGWRSGSGMGFGNRWNCLDPMPSGWSWPKGNYPTQFWPYLYPWGVVFVEQGNTASNGWIEFRNMDWQILYRGESSWTRHVPKTSEIGWGNIFLEDMITDSGVAITKATGSGGGTRVLVPGSRSPHFTFTPTGILVPRVADIEGIMFSCEVRIDPIGDQNVRSLIHLGGDPKPTTGGNASDGVPWYPGACVSAAVRVTTAWRKILSCNLEGIRTDSSQVPRLMTRARLRSVPPKA